MTIQALRPKSRTSCALVIACAALALGACDDRAGKDTASRSADPDVQKAENAVAAGASKAAELAETARDKTEAFIKSPGVQRDAVAAGQALKNAGNAMVATVDDAAITASVSTALAKDPELSAVRIDVNTKGGAVSLRGPAPSAAAKARASEIAKAQTGVSSVDNQLDVRSM
ncbi:BON domain-containing protein [Variovorax sp. PBL-E5]|uniref:BON domain-containing protein n=1 Tax=Variovorax sp. PBL-E5 TaxID=434014 RepID=UPI001319B351|nr:BON domain-containing protein [Variovorax sp. PBL-E5]VTU33607.1 Osmotically-inducible protein Y precursor [Variovorax sp. PBL-E5]